MLFGFNRKREWMEIFVVMGGRWLGNRTLWLELGFIIIFG